MTELLRELFGVSQPIIAMVHLQALPGRPRHDLAAGMRPIVDAVARDLAALQDAGVDIQREDGIGCCLRRVRVAVARRDVNEVPLGVDCWD